MESKMSDPNAPSVATASVGILNALQILRDGLRRAVTSPALVNFALQLQSIADRIDELLAKNREVFERALRDARQLELGKLPPLRLEHRQDEDANPSADLPSSDSSGGYLN
jgi:hypothetical protein